MVPNIDFHAVDVDQLMVKWDEALALRRTRSKLLPLKRFCKKKFVDPILFLMVSFAILVLPQSLLARLSRRRMSRAIHATIIRGLDVVAAVIGLLLAAPLFLIVPIAIKLNSKGPVFYKQVRTGVDRRAGERRKVSIGHGVERRKGDRRQKNMHGRPFNIFKFRTMTADAESKSGAVWAKKSDPRITALGAYLRKYHIDEIPQLINVIRGDMSLVGPRPERPEIITKLLREVPEYKNRLVVKPGVTGPAQIFLGYDSCTADIRRKVQFDALFIDHGTIRFYFLLLALTAVKILSSMIVIQAGLFNLNITLNKESKSEEVTYSHL